MIDGSADNKVNASPIIVKVLSRNDARPKKYYFNETDKSKSIYKIFEDDTIMDIRRKIALATGIPIYAQHITSAGNLMTYELRAENYPHEINIHDLFSQIQWIETVLGLPYDAILYENRQNIRIECFDHEKIIKTLPTREIEVIDAREFLTGHRGMIKENISYFEMIYYGFVLKYWPIISIEVFQDYINNSENYILEKYINLAVDEAFIKKQTAVIENIMSVKKPVELNMLIQSATITMNSIISPINLENLFETFETSRDYPMILYNNTTKEWIESTTQISIKFPSQLKKGVIICIILSNEEQIFISFEPMMINLRIELETRRISSFKEHVNIISQYVNPLIDRINKNIEFISANEIPYLSIHNVKYTMMSINLFWRNILTSKQYEELRDHIESYFNVNIFQYYQRMNFETTSNLVFYFLRGGESNSKKISTKLPENVNYYWFLTNESFAETWNNTFVGSPIKIKHLFADVCFEITNIREINFIILENYLQRILALAHIEKKDNHKGGVIKRLRKLHEYDPILYNLRDGKIENENKLYSIICQGPNQPIIYSQNEVEKMKKSRAKKLVKYWNFTYDEPAYYECPDSKYPGFMFMTGYHPKGYCLPCCKKRSFDQLHKDINAFKVCMTKHTYVEGLSPEEETTAKNRAYLFEFSNNESLGVNRIGVAPHIEKIISPMTEDTKKHNFIYACVGVRQVSAMSRKYGIVSSIAYLLDIPPERLHLRNDDVAQLCIDVIREYRIQPIIIQIVNSHIIFKYDSRYNSNKVCYIMEKPGVAFEPIVLLNITAFSTNLEVERKIWKSRPRLLSNLYIADEMITVGNSMIGTIAKNDEFKPSSEVAFDDKTQIVSLVSLMEAGREPPKHVSSRIISAKIKHLYKGKVWGYDQYIWTSRIDIPLRADVGRIFNWKYDPKLVLRAIDEGTPDRDDPRIVNNEAATYKILFYDMIIMELVKYFTINKNIIQRERIIEVVKMRNWAHLRSIVGTEDLSSILKQINLVGGNTIEFIKILNKTLYNFDRQIYYNLISLDKITLKARLTSIINDITELGQGDIPVPFKYKNNMITYRPIKIVVWPQLVGSIDRYIDMLIDDLNNPLKLHMFNINMQLSRINKNKYTVRRGERILSGALLDVYETVED